MSRENKFYELTEYFELLQANLKAAREAGISNQDLRREILGRMKETLEAMHVEHRRWVESTATFPEERRENPYEQEQALRKANAA